MQISYALTSAQVAALREDLRVTGSDPRENNVEAHALAHVAAAFDALRDRWRTDAIATAAFVLRFSADELTAIRAAATQVPQLDAWLARIESEPQVWLGSNEAEAGKAALVGGGLLTQERADVVFYYPLPELPD